eukprot:NODE_7919_length_728_cov_47.099174_g7303_i0.p1 GENE.NODE_7919_length_728_cov_47.099174_g7303_i0~~NODE_7919_length_728_cov_47.099174_g7303_i0.p1  ORF type:complete len:174 (-),score=29.61 NODE_7919_length_728_cov_47.099174_g7303_i0:129-650(-)
MTHNDDIQHLQDMVAFNEQVKSRLLQDIKCFQHLKSIKSKPADEPVQVLSPRRLSGANVGLIKPSLELLRDELTCPVCLDLFSQDAVTLPSCGHSFCRRCLMSLNFPNCPSCRTPFPPVPKSTFKTSRVLSTTVDHFLVLERLICECLGERVPEIKRSRQPPDYVPDGAPAKF